MKPPINFIAVVFAMAMATAPAYGQRMTVPRVERYEPAPRPAPRMDPPLQTYEMPQIDDDDYASVPHPPPEYPAGANDYSGDSDSDGDGWSDSVDCSDNNATAYPGAAEYSDGWDTDCDGYDN